MTPAELRRIGEALYGPRWATNLARDLGVAKRTVNRWSAGERAIPEGLAVELQRLGQQRQREITAALR